MNKKFSTLLVGALLTSSVGVFAQTRVHTGENTVGNDIKLRPTATASAAVGPDVANFKGAQYYQLADADGKVLIQSRHYGTGKLTLKFVEVANAPINASLWKIDVTGDRISGYSFTYTNLETGFPISYDAEKALKFNAATFATDLGTAPVSTLEGCVTNWTWYNTDDNGAANFGVKPTYSYFTSDSVVVWANKSNEFVAVKAAKADLNNTTLTNAFVPFKPVLAGGIILKAADLNNLVDFQYDDSVRFSMNPGPKNGATALPEVLTKYNFKAHDANTYSVDGFTGGEAGYVVFENKTEGLLMVDTVFHNVGLPSLTPLKISVKLFAKVTKSDGTPSVSLPVADLVKRYQFQVTYYPSVDSLNFEVLEGGALKIKDSEYEVGTAWADAVKLVEGDADTKAGAVLKLVYLTPTHTELTAGKAVVNTEYPTPGTIFTKINFAGREFDGTYLTRVTPAEGLYFIKQDGSGKNIVCNFEGTMQYDVESGVTEKAQDYNNMPATMWVVRSTGCTTVAITNREYAKEADVFTGQLYEKDGAYYFIDDNQNSATMFNKFSYADHLTFTPVENEAAKEYEYHGYKHIPSELLLVKKFYLGYNLFADQDLYLNVTDDKNFAPSKDQSTYYELEEVVEGDKKEFDFGTGVGVAGLPQLKRTAYKLKVKDANLIDNDKVYVFLVTEAGKTPYYKAMTKEQIAALPTGTTYKVANFYLKSDQIRNGEECYVLIDIFDGEHNQTDNGYVQAHCEDAVGALSFLNLDNSATERASAFTLEDVDVTLYRTIAGAKTAKIFRQRGAAKEYLYEDANNKVAAPSVVKDFGYLGLTAEGITPEGKGTTTAMFVQPVAASNEIMPQYLFVVDTDSVADGKWCATDEHGYIKEGEAHSDHTKPYIGYLAGRFLVNLTDSVEAKTGMLNNADKFKYAGYDRLGFVEAIYRVEDDVEYLYILKNGNTLESVQKEYGVVAPDAFADATVFDKKKLDGKHADYVFSLRLIDEDAKKDFLIESNDDKNDKVAIGSFSGAWVKVQNACPVLAKFTTTGSDHADDSGMMQELINNAQIFNIEEGLDEVATGNEGINASSVEVIAANGAVIVKGAAGKKVTISNVLGQTIANTVVSSDNATIAAPQGVVVVAVEGEAAVKAIVK